MARYRGPVGKISRRLGIGITEKGQRILNKRAFPPGQHGPTARRRQVSDYGLQLLEKQKARYMYGVLERQFQRIFEKAQRYPGETGAYLFILLDRRNVPDWLRLNAADLAGEVVSMPRREDAEPDINEQLIVEYYSR